MADVSLLQKGYGAKGGIGGIDTEMWQKILLWFAFVLTALTVVFYVLVYTNNSSLAKEKRSIETSIKEVFKKEEISKLQKLKTFNQSVQFSKAAKNAHTYSSSIFSFLENITLSRVVFSSFTFNTDQLTLSMGASAASYTIMAKQIDIMERDSRIRSVKVSGIGLDPLGGTVRFGLSLTLDPSVIKTR